MLAVVRFADQHPGNRFFRAFLVVEVGVESERDLVPERRSREKVAHAHWLSYLDLEVVEEFRSPLDDAVCHRRRDSAVLEELPVHGGEERVFLDLFRTADAQPLLRLP